MRSSHLLRTAERKDKKKNVLDNVIVAAELPILGLIYFWNSY